MASQHASHHYTPLRNRMLALAAMVQAARLVQSIARKGIGDEVELTCAIDSILAVPGKEHLHAGHLYPEPRQLRTGLILLQRLLSGEVVGADMKETRELMTYCSDLVSLERKLAHDKKMLARLGEGVARIRKQRDYFGSMHDNVIAAVAGLYGETISTLTPRIIVHGKPEHLSQGSNTNKVRALLFAGIRAAHLWRVHGGNRLYLLLRRRKLGREVRLLLFEADRA